MPIYEYQCEQCDKVEEVLQRFSEKSLTNCRHCSGKLHKLISHSAFHLKGTGWYATDYAGKKHQEKQEDKTDKATKADTGPDDSKAEAKSTKSDTQ